MPDAGEMTEPVTDTSMAIAESVLAALEMELRYACPRPEDDAHAHETDQSDPIYAVSGRRT